MTNRNRIMAAFTAAVFCAAGLAIAADASLKIATSGQAPVVLETSVFKATFGNSSGGGMCADQVESNIRSLQIKAKGNQEQVLFYIDASAHAGKLLSAKITNDGPGSKSVRITRGCNSVVNDFEYTIFANSPVIKTEYFKYGGSGNGGEGTWHNIVDIGKPGGVTAFRTNNEIRLYGQEGWKRELCYHDQHECAYYDKRTDGAAGSLLYKGHFIMVIFNKNNRCGWGRVVPVNGHDGKGGCGILKLLPYGGGGFEIFAAWGQASRPGFTHYLFTFTEGPDNAIEMGKRIVDGDMLTDEDPVHVEKALRRNENRAIRQIKITRGSAIQLTLTRDDVNSVKLSDLAGRVVYEADGFSGGKVSIPTTGMSRGTYMVETSGAGGREMIRVTLM